MASTIVLFLGLSSGRVDDVTGGLNVHFTATWDRLARLQDPCASSDSPASCDPSSSSDSPSSSSDSPSSSSDGSPSSSSDGSDSPSSSSEDDEPGMELLERAGSCINPADEKNFTNILPNMNDCGKQLKTKGYKGLRALKFFRECMHTTGGLSPRCAFCPGTLVACRALHCKVCGPQRNDLANEECFECDARCLEKMTKCGGIDKASYATCKKMLPSTGPSGELSWLCDVIHGKDTVQQIYKELFPPKSDLTSIFDLLDSSSDSPSSSSDGSPSSSSDGSPSSSSDGSPSSSSDGSPSSSSEVRRTFE